VNVNPSSYFQKQAVWGHEKQSKKKEKIGNKSPLFSINIARGGLNADSSKFQCSIILAQSLCHFSPSPPASTPYIDIAIAVLVKFFFVPQSSLAGRKMGLDNHGILINYPRI
jgi:hypothetical protein